MTTIDHIIRCHLMNPRGPLMRPELIVLSRPGEPKKTLLLLNVPEVRVLPPLPFLLLLRHPCVTRIRPLPLRVVLVLRCKLNSVLPLLPLRKKPEPKPVVNSRNT